MKNIDKIRQMTADELAEFLLNNECHGCEFCAYIQYDYCADKKCIDGRKEWLEQEVVG